MKIFKIGDAIEFDFKDDVAHGRIIESQVGAFKDCYLVELLGKFRGRGHDCDTKNNDYDSNNYWFVSMWSPHIKLVNNKMYEIHIVCDFEGIHACSKMGDTGKVIAEYHKALGTDFETDAEIALKKLFEYNDSDRF